MCWLLGAAAAAAAGAADPSKRRLPAPCYWRATATAAAAAVPTKTRPSRTGNTMALKDEQGPKYAFPGPERPSKISYRKSLLYVLDAGYWELLLLLTLQKGGFRQGNPMLLKGDSDCCCCCAHKDTAPPGRGTPWP